VTAAAPAVRSTQKQRREATIGKLLDATIESLIEHGYRDTTIGRICKRAGVSHGGLFRHFASRTALLAAATDEMSRRHFDQLTGLLAQLPRGQALAEALVSFIRRATREPLAAAWREVMVAARTDEVLRDAVRPAVQQFEDTIFEMATELAGEHGDRGALGTLLLSILHMYDSEANTVRIVLNEDIEHSRYDWAVKLLLDELQLP
jgi:AcrR family transcriptional regulator